MSINWIRAMRVEIGWTQFVLADRLGIPVVVLSAWENGIVKPSSRHRAMLLDLRALFVPWFAVAEWR